MARLLSVNVGLPRDVAWKGRMVHTGIWKDPVQGHRRVGRLNLDGDGQGDLAGHGGEQRAVFVYQIESYRFWQKELKRSDFVHGQFGENFTIEGLPDDTVCIGDRYQIGSALFEVTQPRVTCYRVGIRLNEPRMPALLTSNGRPGFYFRVLREGEVGAGLTLRRHQGLERRHRHLPQRPVPNTTRLQRPKDAATPRCVRSCLFRIRPAALPASAPAARRSAG